MQVVLCCVQPSPVEHRGSQSHDRIQPRSFQHPPKAVPALSSSRYLTMTHALALRSCSWERCGPFPSGLVSFLRALFQRTCTAATVATHTTDTSCYEVTCSPILHHISPSTPSASNDPGIKFYIHCGHGCMGGMHVASRGRPGGGTWPRCRPRMPPSLGGA